MSFYIAAATACVLLSAFFSGAEMSLSSASRVRLESMRDAGSKAAGVAVSLIDSFDNALSAILIGNNFVNIALSSLGSLIAITAFGEEYAWLATVIVTVTVVIFGETVPKIVAKENANRMSAALAPFIRALSWALFPLVWAVVRLVRLITSPLPGETGGGEEAAVEELQSIIETAEDEDVIDEERSELLQAALDFNEVSASEVMTARVDMLAIDIDDDAGEILRIIGDSTFSRIPVYEDSVDNIIGVLYLNHFFKAMLSSPGGVELRPLLMKPCFIYKTVKLPAVLEQLRRAKMHLAVVTDEYGGTLGLISMEDVLEQLVGEIWDETDVIENEVVEHPGGVFELDGDMVIGDFLELLGRDEDGFDTDSATVGGWTLETFGSFPAEGDTFTFENLSVMVMKMDGLRVEKVLVRVLPEAE